MDIRFIRKQLQDAFGNLNSADFDSAEIAANDFYDFLYNTEPISDIIAKLPKSTINIDEWVKTLYNSSLSLPRDKQERIAFLLAVLEKYKDDLLSIGHYLHAGSNKIIDHIRKYIDTMVKPIYQYVNDELHKKELDAQPVSTPSITANNSIIINGSNYGSISQTNLSIVHSLNELSNVLQLSDKLTNDEKLEAVNNIDTIKNQAVSPKPNKQIIKLAWDTVSAMATTAGATDLVTKIALLVANLSA